MAMDCLYFMAANPVTLRDHAFRTYRRLDCIPALLHADRYAVWSHPNLSRWLLRERIAVPKNVMFPWIAVLDPLNDQLWEGIEMIQPVREEDLLQVTE
jgi:hypothetical protein